MALIEGATPGICVGCGGPKDWVKTSQLCYNCYPIAQQEWATPPDLWVAIEARFGEIDIDVCASKENSKCGNIRYINKYDDGLSNEEDWIRDSKESGEILRSAYCNPGFKTPLPWAQKAYSEAQRHKDSLVLQLGLTNHSAKWRDYAHAHAEEALLLRPRPQFISAPGIDQTSNRREITLFVYRHDSKILVPGNVFVWNWKENKHNREVGE